MSDPKRRRRPVGRPQVPPGPLRALKDFVYELYLRADSPTLDTMAAWIEADGELAGAPDRTTVGRVIGEPKLPPSQADVVAVVVVLARAVADDVAHAAARAAQLWLDAWLVTPVGKPLAEVVDPFALEVHRPIALDDTAGQPPLPRYVRRAHDDRLEQVVARAADGESAMAVLVAGSSAGKTRACWEALEQLRADGRWRLWHPYDPTRPEAALEALDLVGPRTVVWLNETQEYLKGRHGERVAAKIRSLLSDAGRAPVLVLGTLWPEYHTDLTRESGSQVRLVLDGTVIEVPEGFGGDDLARLKESAVADTRLAWAAAHADDGQITQCLAGGPALLERYYGASAAAKAFIQVAMDAVRMGHRNALPRELLETAVDAYLTDAQYSGLEGNWQETAFADISAPCKGALGPVTRIPERANSRERRKSRTRQPEPGEPLYRLADYLDQYGRTQRADHIPPVGFWTAAVLSAKPESLASLARSAWARGLYRDAVEINKKAAELGNVWAGTQLVEQMHMLHPGDRRPAEWVVAHAALDPLYPVVNLMDKLQSIDARDCLRAVASKAAAGLPLNNSAGLGYFLLRLPKASLDQVDAFLARDPASAIALNNQADVRMFLEALLAVGAGDQVQALLARDPASHVEVADINGSTGELIALLHASGAEEQATILAARAAADSPLSWGYSVAGLLSNLNAVGYADKVAVVLDRSPAACVALDGPGGVARLLKVLHDLGAGEEVTVLAARAAMGTHLQDPRWIAELLQALSTVGEDDQVAALLARDPASSVSLDSASAVGALLSELLALGAREQVVILARRAAAGVPLSGVFGAESLLQIFCSIRAYDEVRVLLERGLISEAVLTNEFGGRRLLRILASIGAREQVVELAMRIAKEFPLENSRSLASALETLNEVGAADQMAVLLARRPEEFVVLRDPFGAAMLLSKLQEIGARRQLMIVASRAVQEASLDDPLGASALLERFETLGMKEEADGLLERRPSAYVSVAMHTFGLRRLLVALCRWGRDDQVLDWLAGSSPRVSELSRTSSCRHCWRWQPPMSWPFYWLATSGWVLTFLTPSK
ncbi:hypothetical protein [Amycolatopsis sp. NPDC051102]|uniref:hypothetical protein n=1 Tax=Amycolatopsis sp. NPDC051102 TaxID=3155163 RepID=UPI0034234BAA